MGRWLIEDPIGFNAGDGNLYRYVGNGPVNGTDPSGLRYRGSWRETWDTIYYLPGAIWDNGWGVEQSQTLASYIDGVIPFSDPLSNLYNPCDTVFQHGRLAGNIARDALFAIYTFGTSTWAELGNTTVPNSVWQIWQELGITGDAAAKAAWLSENYGIWGRFVGLKAPWQLIKTTFTTGPNVGGGLGLNAVVQAADSYWFSPKCP